MIAAANFWPDFMKNEAGNLLCTYLAERGGNALGAFAGGAIGSYFGPGGTKPGIGVGSALGGAGGAALGAALCPSSPPTDGEFPFTPGAPPFSGGQCAVDYSVTVTYDRYIGNTLAQEGQVQNAQQEVRGPIESIKFRDDLTKTRIIHNFGNIIDFPSGTGPTGTNLRNLRDITVVRRDGGDDNCGNPTGPNDFRIPSVPDQIPPLSIDPFARRPINIDVDFGGPTINIDGDIILDGPNIGPGGGLEVCYTFNGLRFCIDLDGNVRIGPGDRNSPSVPGDDGQPPPTDDPARVLSGVFYETVSTGAGQSFETIGGERYFYPRFGSVTFTGLGEQSQPVEMRSEKGYLENPAPSVFSTYSFDAYQVGNSASFRDLWEKECQIPTPEIT